MKRFIPSFLKQIDNYLLLNHPIIWISKIHYVIFYGIITTVLSALSGIVIPVSLSHPQDLALWYFLFTILAIIALCFWVYHNVIFNLEKKFGKRHWVDEYKIFLVNFCCVFVLASFPIAFTAIYNARFANTVSNAEFINDINTLNKGEAYVMMDDINNYSSNYDSTGKQTFYDLKTRITFDSYTPWLMRYDTVKFKGLLTNNDLKKIYDTSQNEQHIKSCIHSYLSVLKTYGFYKEAKSLDDTLLKRYKYLLTLPPVSNSDLFNNYIMVNHYEINKILDNVAEAKFIPLFIWKSEFLNFILYTCLYISMLVMLFKMVPWKQYLVTLISLIIIPILLFIISQLIPYTSNVYKDTLYLFLLTLIIVIAIVMTLLSIMPAKRFNAFKNICAQITYLSMPVFPLMIISLFKNAFFNAGQYEYGMTDIVTAEGDGGFATNYYNTPQYIYMQLENRYWQNLFDTCFNIAIYGGIILFILIIVPLMKQLFVKQLALPQKN